MLYSKQMLNDLAAFMTIKEIRIQILKIGRRRHTFKTLSRSSLYRWMRNEANPDPKYKYAVVKLYDRKLAELNETKKAFTDRSREFGSIPQNKRNAEPVNFF